MKFFRRFDRDDARRDDHSELQVRVNILEAEMRNTMQELDQLKADVAALAAANVNMKARLDAHAAAAPAVPAADLVALSNEVKALTSSLDAVAPATAV